MKATPCTACGAACMFADPDPHSDEPCYGEVRAIRAVHKERAGYVDELYEHACEGHKRGGLYVEQDEGAE